MRRDKSTTRLRVVYDASAKSANSPSLNDCLLKGQKFNQLIFDLLVRFRLHKIALTADLEKAFLMVSVDEADCDVLRYIWVEDTSALPESVPIYSSCVWSLIKSFPPQCHHTFPLREVPGDK